MIREMSPEDYVKFRNKANKLATKAIGAMENEPNDEILCAAMTIITFVLSLNATSKENAFNALAALFSIGDKMLEEADELGVTKWKGYKDKH